MSAERLREAAQVLLERAATEAVLREGDPHFAPESLEVSAWDRVVTPAVGRALAEWLDAEAWFLDTMPPSAADYRQASAVADAILGGAR